MGISFYEVIIINWKYHEKFVFIQKIGFPHIINLGIYEITKDPSRPNILPGTLLSDSDATDVKARLSQHPDDRKHPRGNCSIPGTNPL